MKTLPILYENKPSYSICYSSDFSDLCTQMENIFACTGYSLSKRSVCIISDDVTASLYAENIAGRLRLNTKQLEIFILPSGEENKTLDVIQSACAFLISHHFDRHSVLIALGGGVIGDMTGFLASVYLRGIDFVQIPTTLLAQADSCIGGKTGVNFSGYKNMIGTFKMPVLVYSSPQVLLTLEKRVYLEGFAEIMKHALISDADYYRWLADNRENILSLELPVLTEMLFHSNRIKKEIVEKDPLEKRERMLLNFGHTVGHAIEKYYGFSFLHGECVALGCVAAAEISFKKGFLSEEDRNMIRKGFSLFSLPVQISSGDPKAILELTKSDKKRRGDRISFVLLKKIGEAFIDDTVTEEEIFQGISCLIH